jgi:hypothetical protein
VAQLRPKRLAQLEPKWVAQLRPFYLKQAKNQPIQILFPLLQGNSSKEIIEEITPKRINILGGARKITGEFNFLNEVGYWWSATENSNAGAWFWFIKDNSTILKDIIYDHRLETKEDIAKATNRKIMGRNGLDKKNGLSVLCIKDFSI